MQVNQLLSFPLKDRYYVFKTTFAIIGTPPLLLSLKSCITFFSSYANIVIKNTDSVYAMNDIVYLYDFEIAGTKVSHIESEAGLSKITWKWPLLQFCLSVHLKAMRWIHMFIHFQKEKK